MFTRKNIYIAGSTFFLLLLIFILTTTTNVFQKLKDDITPNLYLTKMQVNNLSSDQVNMDMFVLFDNPLPVDVNMDSLSYTIFIENTIVAKSTYRDSLKMESGDSSTISLPVTLNFKKLESILKKLENNARDSVDYTIMAKVYEKNWITGESFDIKIEKQLPVIMFPKTQIQNLSVKHVGLKETSIEVTANVNNPNIFSFGLKDIQLQLQLDDNKVLNGTKEGTVELPSESTTPISFTFSLNLNEAFKSLIDLIKEGKDLEFYLSMNADVASDQDILKQSKIKLKVHENLKDLQKFAQSNN